MAVFARCFGAGHSKAATRSLTSQTPRGPREADFGRDSAEGHHRTDCMPDQPVAGMSAAARRVKARRARPRGRQTTASVVVCWRKRWGQWRHWPGGRLRSWSLEGGESRARTREPWRGTKPMEGEGAWSPATVGRATDPTAEQGPEAEGRHQQPVPRVQGRGGGTTARGQRSW